MISYKIGKITGRGGVALDQAAVETALLSISESCGSERGIVGVLWPYLGQHFSLPQDLQIAQSLCRVPGSWLTGFQRLRCAANKLNLFTTSQLLIIKACGDIPKSEVKHWFGKRKEKINK